MLEMLKPKASMEFLWAGLQSPTELASRVCGGEGKQASKTVPRRKRVRGGASLENLISGLEDEEERAGLGPQRKRRDTG